MIRAYFGQHDKFLVEVCHNCKEHVHMYLTFAVALKAVNGIGCSESWKNLKWNIKKKTKKPKQIKIWSLMLQKHKFDTQLPGDSNDEKK